MNDWARWIAELRAAPRVDPGRTRLPSGFMRRVVSSRQRLAAEGQCVWGFLGVAVSPVWTGRASGPASVVYSPDRWFDPRPFDLDDTALPLGGLDGAPDPAIALVGSRDPLGPHFGVRLPADLTRGRVILRSTTWIHLDDLPNNRLRGYVLPLWVDPGGLTLPVPADRWPEGLRRAWEED